MKNFLQRFSAKDSSWRSLKLSLFSALLLSLPWVIGGALIWTVFVGFVPLLIMQHERGKGFLWWAALTFFAWIMLTCWWVGVATPVALVMVPVVGMVFMFLPFALWHRVTKNAPRALKWTLFVTIWIVAEAAYTYGDISFPWLTLGNAFASNPFMVQWYSFTGVFGGSLWVLVLNVLLAESMIYRKSITGRYFPFAVSQDIRKQMRGHWTAISTMFFIIVPVVSSFMMGFFYEAQSEKVAKVTIVQPNIDPYGEKFSGMTAQAQLDLILSLAGEAPSDVDYIVAPETALEGLWEHEFGDNEQILAIRDFLRVHAPSARMVIGATTYQQLNPDEADDYNTYRHGDLRYRVYNSALWVDSAGGVDVYHKSKLVCGAELLPYPAFFSWLKEAVMLDLGGFSGNLGRSERREVYSGTGTAVCYEALYGEFYTEYIEQGAELMFVISNDGWWGDTPGYRGLLNVSRLRAVETRRGIARSANTGISAIILGDGEISSMERLGWDVRGTITGELTLNDGDTFYVRYGDYVVRLSFYVMVLSLLYMLSLFYRRRSHL